MKIGFPNHPRKDLLKEIEWIGKNGFDFVDLFLEEDRATPERIDISKLKQVLRKYGLETVGHTAWYLPIGSPMKALRKAAVQELKRYFPVFNSIGTEYVTIHANWPGMIFSDREGVKFQAETLKELVELAGGFGLKLLYEPIDSVRDSLENVSMILKRVPGLYFHLDIGHANLYGRKPEEFIRRFRSKLKHVHLHDNHGNFDAHLPMGCGSIEWEKVLKVLKKYYNGTITLEVFSREKKYVLLTRKKLKELWKKL